MDNAAARRGELLGLLWVIAPMPVQFEGVDLFGCTGNNPSLALGHLHDPFGGTLERLSDPITAADVPDLEVMHRHGCHAYSHRCLPVSIWGTGSALSETRVNRLSAPNMILPHYANVRTMYRYPSTHPELFTRPRHFCSRPMFVRGAEMAECGFRGKSPANPR